MRPQKEKERKAFEVFLQACPSLAARIDCWRVQEEEGAFPDVLATLRDGQVLGFELGEWLHEEQVRQDKKTHQFELDILRAIGPQPENGTRNVHCVLLAPGNDRMGFDQQDREKLRQELINLIDETDQQWPKERHWQSPQGYHCKEFGRFPTLTRYLTEVWFVPRVTGKVKKEPRPPGIPWIHVEGRGGSYSGESARKALQAIISKKASHYGGSSSQGVHLLIHYGVDAFRYNTPFLDVTTPDFEAVAMFAGEVMQSCFLERQLPLEKVYLCNTLPSELEAYEIFPQVLRCS
jgi:hypothetical protein